MPLARGSSHSVTRVGGFLGPPLCCFGHMTCLIYLPVGVVPRSFLLEFRLFCVGHAYNRSLGRVFRSAGDHLVIFCFRLLGHVFRSAVNRISCFLDFYLLISRFLVVSWFLTRSSLFSGTGYHLFTFSFLMKRVPSCHLFSMTHVFYAIWSYIIFSTILLSLFDKYSVTDPFIVLLY